MEQTNKMKFPDRHVQRRKVGSWKRIVWYLILLAVILVLMWQMPAIVHRLPL
jgi:hypothetical protein